MKEGAAKQVGFVIKSKKRILLRNRKTGRAGIGRRKYREKRYRANQDYISPHGINATVRVAMPA
jgi:hypothetical protein